MNIENNLEYKWFNKSAKKLAETLYLPTINNQYISKTNINGISYEHTNYYKPLNFDFKENISHMLLNIDKGLKKFESNVNKIMKKGFPLEKNNRLINLLGDKLGKDINNSDKIIKSYKYELDFTKQQKDILNIWFSECDKVYNKCVELYNKTSNFNLNYKKTKLDIFKIIYGNNKKSAPYDTLTDEVRIFCSNIKSCLTNLMNKNIKHYTITERNIKNQQSIFISKNAITKNGIFSSILGKIKNFNKIDTTKIATDCRLLYNKKFNKYYLCIPEYQNRKLLFNRKPVIALDPGEKNFMSYYSLSEYGKMGIDMRKPILKLRNKISILQRAMKKKINKNKKKLKNKLKIKRKIQKKYNKIKNIVKELHNQTALYLCKNYDKILLPKFETKKMVYNKDERTKKIKENMEKIKQESKSTNEIKEKINEYRKRRKMNRKTAFVLNQLSHYRFKQHILNKSQEYGCQVIIVEEEYTSQACGNCGQLSKKYKDRIKECENCKHKIDRDINGARNILIKNHKEVMK